MTVRRRPAAPELPPRSQILAVALELMGERGPEATSLRALAERLDLHNSTLLHYFPTKRALVEALAEAAVERQRIALGEAPDPPDAEAAWASLGAWLAQLAAEPAQARLLLRLWVAAPEDPGSPAVARLLALLSSWLGRALPDGTAGGSPPSDQARRVLAIALAPGSEPEGDLGALRALLGR